MDDLLKQWHAIITEGFANPSPALTQRLARINRLIAAAEAEEASQRAEARRALSARIEASKARIAELNEQIGLRV